MVGIITTTVLYKYDIYMKNKRLSVTVTALANINGALQDHVATYGFYPCPADRSVPVGDADYGKSTDCANNPPLPPCNNFNRGVCRTVGATNRIYIGGVPFKELHLSEDIIYDAWKSRITYALTSALEPNSPPLSPLPPGEITVEQSDGSGLTINDAHYVLVAHGPQRVGGFNHNGTISNACDVSEREHENCDNDDVFAADSNGRWRNLNDGAGYFDDFTRFEQNVNIGEWNVEAATPNDLRFSFDRVGIGVTDANPATDLHVAGDIKVDDWMKANMICNVDTNPSTVDCFDPEAIAGSKSAMRCDAGLSTFGNQAMIGVAEEKVNCSLAIDPSVITPAPCAAGKLAVGFLPNGQLDCQLF